MKTMLKVRRLAIYICMALLGTLTLVPPAMGEEAAELEPSSDAKEAAYTRKPVCKKEAAVGTRISKTVCRTSAVQDAERTASQEYLKNIQDSSAIQGKSAH